MHRFLFFLLLTTTLFGDQVADELVYANTMLNLGNEKEAIPIYKSLLTSTLDPYKQAIIRYNLGTAYLQTDQPLKALELFQEVDGLPPSSLANLYYNSAFAYTKLSSEEATPALSDHFTTQSKLLLQLAEKNYCQWQKIKGDPNCPHFEQIKWDRKEIPKIVDEIGPFLEVIRGQERALELTLLLPFLDPYSDKGVNEAIDAQEKLQSYKTPFIKALVDLQKERNGSCDSTHWQAVTNSFEKALDLMKQAAENLKNKALPLTVVVPLQESALKELRRGQQQLRELMHSHRNAPSEDNTELERLLELYQQDKAVEPIKSRKAQEGIRW